MNSTSFDQILRRVLIVPIMAVLIGAAALYWQMHDANLTVARIGRADANIALTIEIEKIIVDQETGLRGFQTTGNASFLAPYRNGDQPLEAGFDQLRELTDNPRIEADVNDLQNSHDAWEAGFASPLIATIKAGGHTSDVELNLLGKRQMDDIRRRIGALTRGAEIERDQAIAHWLGQVHTMTVALIGLACVIGLAIGLYTRRLVNQVSDAYRQSHNTLRVRAEQTFRSEQKLRTTLQSIGDGVITCSKEGFIQTMNDVAQELTGWDEAAARDLPLERVFHILNQTTREPVENPVTKVARLDRTVGLANHTILVRKDGRELFIDDSGAPIRDPDGDIIGVVLVFRDVTLARKSQEALLANEKLAVAGRLAATIAHEIHNPLDSVSNLLFLMDGKSSPEEHAQFLLLARQEINRVTQISRAMLSLYREARSPVPIDLKETLESILLLLDRRFHSLGVHVTAQLPEGINVQGFPAELRQVFTNLLTNAAEAVGQAAPNPDPYADLDDADLPADPATDIRVEAHALPPGTLANGIRHEAGVRVDIIDHGPGIPEEICRELFKPFFTTKGERGTGLGLWVSKGIVTKHGGSIDIKSSIDPEDHGTTVSVFLAESPVMNASAL